MHCPWFDFLGQRVHLRKYTLEEFKVSLIVLSKKDFKRDYSWRLRNRILRFISKTENEQSQWKGFLNSMNNILQNKDNSHEYNNLTTYMKQHNQQEL